MAVIANSWRFLRYMERYKPDAKAMMKGAPDYPEIQGTVSFYQTSYGVLVLAEIFGLPVSKDDCRENIFGFHIHEGASCTGNEQDPFADTGGHYNPGGCEHPYHAGDLPPLFGNGGYAWSAVLTDRFKIEDIIGRTVVIHSNPDDFTTQPSGNSGIRIACGKIL
ncbi:MAG TPA: superoxide dismutase family protein [Bacillota bacterium]|nr:superoxide dismutase family protein [Bacillota bacterium]HOK67886.1 superoxide dismutase family protein [Bacillota bacterium]HOQ14161.1 superoxide dismutase family protein [Bacillota bacterium]HPP84277.1 superoxide dismutase family protein [Bacillota bacterium]